jgi:coenzyme Q-binding protein COQ10
MRVGWKGITESFTSRQFFVPGRVVESVSGATETDLSRDEIRHHLEAEEEQRGQAVREREEETSGLLTHLRSRWTIEPLAKESTEVTLSLEFAFANPMYGALSAGVAPKIADTMIKAFEQRIIAVLDQDPEMAKATLKEMKIWRRSD